MDWIPRSRDVRDTVNGRMAARTQGLGDKIMERGVNHPVHPHGKSAMIAGGLGCLRLAMKTMGGAEVKFLSASSTGMAHAGIVVAVRANDYASIGGLIAELAAFAARSPVSCAFGIPTSICPWGLRLGYPVSTSLSTTSTVSHRIFRGLDSKEGAAARGSRGGEPLRVQPQQSGRSQCIAGRGRKKQATTATTSTC